MSIPLKQCINAKSSTSQSSINLTRARSFLDGRGSELSAVRGQRSKCQSQVHAVYLTLELILDFPNIVIYYIAHGSRDTSSIFDISSTPTLHLYMWVHCECVHGSNRDTGATEMSWEKCQWVSDLTEIRGRVSQNTHASVERGNGCWAVVDPSLEEGSQKEMRRD